MHVTVVKSGDPHEGAQPGGLQQYWAGTDPALPDAGWSVRAVIGASPRGGLILPQAEPTESWLYAPRGVHLDADRTIVADTGNHRVMVFSGHPDVDETPCDFVLGQADAHSEGPQAAGRGPEQGFNLPTGVLVTDDGRLIVADAWNHRILIWNEVPTADCPADIVLGQQDHSGIEPNGGGDASATVFYWPFGIAIVDGRFYVADTGNRRVMIWNDGLPSSPDVPADIILGQPDAFSRDENGGDAADAGSFRWPHAVVGDGNGGVLIADAGNHRVLRWNKHPESTGQDADGVLGQPDFVSSSEFPYQPQTSTVFRFPYGITIAGGDLAVADTANNRILIWDGIPADQEVVGAAVLGQESFSDNGENRWQAVTRESLCWPYGLAAWDNLIAVADSGNNRVVLWERDR